MTDSVKQETATLTPEDVIIENEDVEVEEVQEPVQEVETSKVIQTPEQNRFYANARREAEQARLSAEQSKQQLEALTQALNSYGLQGDPLEIADYLTADKTGRSVDDIRAERTKFNEYNTKLQELELQKQALEEIAYNTILENDLKELQKLNPSIKSINDVPDDYWQLRGLGWDVKKSASVIKAAPKDIGSLKSEPRDKEFYTSEELDRLTRDDLNDPKILERALKSMEKLK